MKFSRFVLVALALATALALSGCVVTTGLTGVTVREGQVVALVRVCYSYTASQVDLWGYGDGDGKELGVWEMSGSSADVELGSLASVADLLGSSQANLGALASDGFMQPVRFVMTDLLELLEGSVLVDGPLSKPAVLTLSQFDGKVAHACA